MYVYVCVRICIYVSVYTCICMYCMDIHKYKCIYRTTSFYIQCVVVKPKGSIVRLPVGNNKTINRYIYVDARVAIEVKVIVVKSNASHDLVCQKKDSKFLYDKDLRGPGSEVLLLGTEIASQRFSPRKL